MFKSEDIKNATFEAIYWWNRSEGYYHKYFSRLDELSGDIELLRFFSSKIFKVFLDEYSIRRNLASGDESPNLFLIKLMARNFFDRVKEGKISVIDDISERFKDEGKMTNNRHSRSLLSKISFLINPDKFSLMDQYAKDSLWKIVKDDGNVRKKDLDTYSKFIGEINRLIEFNSEDFEDIQSTLDNFTGSVAFNFFSKNHDIFKRRIFDKYLWLIKAQADGKCIDNTQYPNFYKF